MKYLTKIAGTEQLSYEFKGKHSNIWGREWNRCDKQGRG